MEQIDTVGKRRMRAGGRPTRRYASRSGRIRLSNAPATPDPRHARSFQPLHLGWQEASTIQRPGQTTALLIDTLWCACHRTTPALHLTPAPDLDPLRVPHQWNRCGVPVLAGDCSRRVGDNDITVIPTDKDSPTLP